MIEERHMLNEQLESTPRSILLCKHRESIRAAALTNLLGRTILVGIILLQIVLLRTTIPEAIAIFVVGVAVSLSWWLNASMQRKAIDVLEGLLVDAYSADSDRRAAFGKSDFISDAQTSVNSWITAYVSLQHEKWKNSRLLMVQNLEPFFWASLQLLFLLFRLVLHKL
jgi:hypothetical protein